MFAKQWLLFWIPILLYESPHLVFLCNFNMLPRSCFRPSSYPVPHCTPYTMTSNSTVSTLNWKPKTSDQVLKQNELAQVWFQSLEVGKGVVRCNRETSILKTWLMTSWSLSDFYRFVLSWEYSRLCILIFPVTEDIFRCSCCLKEEWWSFYLDGNS